MMNDEKVTLDDLKFSIDVVGYETRFWYQNLLYYIGPKDNGKWIIWANKTRKDSEPLFVVDNVADPWQYDFGDGKTLTDIYKDIRADDVITK